MVTSRIASTLVLSLVFVLSIGACRRDRCVSVCEQRQKELGCQPRKSCKVTCDELHDPSSPCAAEFRGWEACILKVPLNQWECGQDGQPSPLQSTCPDERSKVGLCMSKVPH
jgi:hypothetical protein